MPVVRSSVFASLTVTQLVAPSKVAALPYFPAVVQVVPLVVPLLPLPDRSVTLVPVPSLKPYDATSPVGGGGAVLETVTVTPLEVPVFPAVSRGTAVMTCCPFGTLVESHATEYGDDASSAPTFAPSTLNWTPATPTLSLALALSVAVPVRVAPPDGAVIVAVGGALSTVTWTLAAVAGFPAASCARAVSVWVPAAAVVVFQVTENGGDVTSEPRFPPSSLNWTPVTPTSSVADAVTATVPPTTAPEVGAVIATDGGVVSGPLGRIGRLMSAWISACVSDRL